MDHIKLDLLDEEYKKMSKMARVSAQAVKDFAATVRTANVNGLYQGLAEATTTAVEATERVAAEATCAQDAVGEITTIIKARVR
jgi:hypothetical protein